MPVTLDKLSDESKYGGHSSPTYYEKNTSGTVPEYVLGWRRFAARKGAVTADQAYYLRSNDLRVLSGLYARTLR